MRHLIFAVAALIVPLCAFGQGDGTQYSNPVMKTSHPDPTIMRDADGWYYLFATEDTAIPDAAATRNVPIYRSSDLVNWQFVSTAFTDFTRPAFLSGGGRICAPDINYINGRYVLYYSLSNWDHSNNFTSWDVQWNGHAVGVASASRIEGPYQDHGKLFISTDIGVQSSIDQFYFEEEDGSKWLFWGSFHGIYATELSDDGLSLKDGAEKQRVAGTLIEGTIVHKRGGRYYMIGSAGSCCNGADATYHLVVARSENLLGPYIDKDGLPALTNHFSEVQHGNKYAFGTGHCSEIVEDDAGRTWLVHHGYQAGDIEAGRVLYLSEVQWDSEGWPYVVGEKPAVEWDRPTLADERFTYSGADYIEYAGAGSEADCLFDTGYVPKENTRIEIRCRVCSKDADGKGTTGRGRTIFSAGASKAEGFSLCINADGAYWGCSLGGYVNDNVAALECDTDCTVSADRFSLTINGRSHPADFSAYGGTSRRLTLFNGVEPHPFIGRIYSLRIYEGDVLVHDYEPCVRNEDGMPIFHDTVTDSLIRPYDPTSFSAVIQ